MKYGTNTTAKASHAPNGAKKLEVESDKHDLATDLAIYVFRSVFLENWLKHILPAWFN